MPSLKAIRTRIASVKNTQKITKAMKLVAAARLRRAQDAIIAARPYAQRLNEVLGDVTARLSLDAGEEAHPLLAKRPVKVARLIIVSADRGLAGGFNSNVVRRAQRFMTENGERYEKVLLSTMGRKARDFLRARKLAIRKDYAGIHQNLAYGKAIDVAKELGDRFLAGEVDAVFLCYNEFKSAISQNVVVRQLLPIETAEAKGGAPTGFDFLYEPSRERLLEELVPKHLAIQVWRALLDSAASEHGARMTAMESATKNAEEMIAGLTLQYNRARQAYVTKELMEIVSGAEALK